MCKDNDHGGQRCPSDTSESRRLRRKASSLRGSNKNSSPATPGITIVAGGNKNLSLLKTKAEELREQAYNAPTDPKEQAKYDAKIEKAITELGVELAAEAEKIAGFDIDQVKKSITQLGDDLYSEINKRIEENRKLKRGIYDIWDNIAEITGLSTYSVRPEDLTEEQLRLLSDEEKEAVAVHLAASENGKAIMKEYGEVDAKYNAKQAAIFAESNRKLTEAYQQVISAIRPIGGEAQFNVSKAGAAEQLMKETVASHYPSSWLEHHNKNGGSEVVVMETDSRPAYNSSSLSEDETVSEERPVEFIFHLTAGEEKTSLMKLVNENFPEAKVNVKLGTKNWFSQEKEQFFQYQAVGEEIYHRRKHGAARPSEATGWKFKPTLASLGLPEFQEAQGISQKAVEKVLLKKHWVREVKTNQKEIRTLAVWDEKTEEEIKNDGKETHDLRKAIAYHEFGHRMEEVLPNRILPRQEKAFLKRRTGKTDDNYYENMVNTGNNGEFGHEGGFVSKYVGRDYFKDNNFEVFTTGIEALYGGGYGGLVGNSTNYFKTDYDHRGFVLGILATL